MFSSISSAISAACNVVVTSANAVNRIAVAADNYAAVVELHSEEVRETFKDNASLRTQERQAAIAKRTAQLEQQLAKLK